MPKSKDVMKTKLTSSVTLWIWAVLLLHASVTLSQVTYLKGDTGFTVVIDPGHGGHDYGTSGADSHEKDVVLQISMQIGNTLQDMMPGAKVVYTRESDVFVPLDKRIGLANDIKADLFVSVHCNSSPHARSATGTETYVMGLHSSDENLEVAKRENSSVLLEDDYLENYTDFDPFSVEGHILLSAIQNDHLGQSIGVAQRVQKHVKSKAGLMDRGVRQAGFVLLRKATMPAILIESAFLSNASDETYVLSEEGQKKLSRSVAMALAEYGRDVITQKNLLAQSVAAPGPGLEMEESTNGETAKHASLATDNDPPSSDDHSYTDDTTESSTPKIPYHQQTSSRSVVFKVQVASTKKPMPAHEIGRYDMLGNLEVKVEDDLFKYVVGQYENLEEAIQEQIRVRAMGFNGAFVVAYNGEERVRLSDIGS